MALVLLLLSCLSPSAAEGPVEVRAVEAPSAEPAVQALAEADVPQVLAASDPWTLREGAAKAGVGWPPPGLRLAVHKSSRTLEALSGETVLKRYRVGLGVPEGDKERQGDGRTPEGELTIVTHNAKSQFHRFLGLSYPSADDADRGLAQGLISASEAAAIRAADKADRLPPWNTALGGTVGIHGGGGWSDWTLGCVAVTDEEIEELFEVVHVGARVSITP